MRSSQVARMFAAAILCSAGTARAGIIVDTRIVEGSFNVVGRSIGDPPSPNNENSVGPSPNVVGLNKDFAGVGPIGIEFTILNSGITIPGTTEYFFDELRGLGIINHTGVAWTDFHFELGFGSGAGFVQANPASGLDFDTPNRDPTPTASNFTILNHQAETIDWSGGSILNGQTAFFTFSVDVPDWSAAIPVGFETRDSQGNITGYRFALRQTPSIDAPVPEPGTLALTGLGMLCMVGSVRMRKNATT
jgi:PEP-CTERM motif